MNLQAHPCRRVFDQPIPLAVAAGRSSRGCRKDARSRLHLTPAYRGTLTHQVDQNSTAVQLGNADCDHCYGSQMLAEQAADFEPGDAIAMCDVRGGVVRAVSTAVVVEHSPEHLVTWIPLGSPLLLPGDAEGRLVKTEHVERLIEVPWNSWGGPVFVWPHGGWHSVRASWGGVDEDRSLDHWYINLHTPLQRSPYGFDLEDLILDVIVKPDRQSWSWKDEAEFDRACAAGIIDAKTGANSHAWCPTSR